MQGSSGYTIIELMVVVTIIGIMSSVAVMQLDPNAVSAEKAVSRTVLLLQRAKAQAALRSRPVGCQVNSNGTFCFVRPDDLVAPTAYNLDAGLIKAGSGDVAEVVGQTRIDPSADIDAASSVAIDYAGAALGEQFFFLPDGIVVDTSEGAFSGSFGLRKEGITTRVVQLHHAGAIQDVAL